MRREQSEDQNKFPSHPHKNPTPAQKCRKNVGQVANLRPIANLIANQPSNIN
jgi:hypothetical protein